MELIKGSEIDLYFENEVLRKTEVEEFLLKEIRSCIHNKEDLLIHFPNSKFIIPIILESVITNETEYFNDKGDPTKRSTILFITNNKEIINVFERISIKSEDIFEICKFQHQTLMNKKVFCDINDTYNARFYWRHILSNYYNNEIPDLIPLHYFLPISTGYHTFNQLSRGKMNKIGRKDNSQESVYLITNNINALNNNLINYDYVFIDFSTINKPVTKIPKGSLCFFDQPLDDRINYLNNNGTKKYLIDSKMLEFYTENDPDKANSPFSRRLSEMVSDSNISRVIIEYVDSEFEEQLEEAFVLLKRLLHKNFDSYDLRLLRTLLYNIIRMPVEGVLYDAVAKYEPLCETIRDLLKELKESDNRYEDSDFENIIKCLENIYNKNSFDTFCPKYETLEKVIFNERQAGNSIGIVSSNKINNIALKDKLAILLNVEIDKLEEKGIRFYNKKKLIKNQEAVQSDTLVLLSAININDFNSIVGGKHKKTLVLLYKLEINELKKKFSKLKDIDNLALSFFENGKRDILHINNVYKYFYNRLRKFKLSGIIDSDEDFSLTRIENSLRENSNTLKKRLEIEYQGENAVRAKLVKFDGEGVLFLRLNSKVRIIKKRPKKVIVKNSSELNPGDEVILVDNDSRKDLFNVFIKNIEVTNQSTINYSMIEKWRELFEDKFVSLKLDDDFLYRKLRKLGWDKSTKSILRNWRSGYSFGPRDIKDIELLGKALDIEDFINNSKAYFDAMSKIRVERRVAARILNKLIYYSKRKMEKMDIKFLEKYNLSHEDLRNAIKVRKIIGISEKVYKVKPSEIGIFHEIKS
ncbi:DISARM system-associated protein DrmE [Oceanobacillus kimchii]|uniref:DISARM protein DrmE C-terminal domain-containing protein n=1 Tax=Oceanobacillus kimchii TaxID=746691 RepID=A0ABQ5TCU7_9BACI|nr:DISARM system-associated protein DrmE [Oceanobacillus kimchii]GLO64428.1 hypothetical protein MACH08_02120 [Oceanobacillus kimchii]